MWGEGVIVRDAEGNVFRARLLESLDEKPNHWIQISNPPSIKWYRLHALGWMSEINPGLQFLQGLCAVWQCPVDVHHGYLEKVVVVEMTVENYLCPFQDMDTMFLRTMGKVGEFIQ